MLLMRLLLPCVMPIRHAFDADKREGKMIAALTGRVLSIGSDKVIVDVSGVGYEVFLTTDALSKLPEKGGEVFLHIHTQVREDAITLYGFPDEEEKEMFLTLKTVSGIGPKLALGVLSGIKVGELCTAIVEGDVKRLTALQGVGKKTAERICVELKDKVVSISSGVDHSSGSQVSVSGGAAGSALSDALSALANLGYPDPVARQALSSVKKRLGDDSFASLGVEDLLRETLRSLA